MRRACCTPPRSPRERLRTTTEVIGAPTPASFKVIVGGARVSLAAMRKAMDLGVAAIVSGGFAYQDVRELLGYDVGVAVTGTEDLPTTLVVTEGFGDIAMAKATFALLQSPGGVARSPRVAQRVADGRTRHVGSGSVLQPPAVVAGLEDVAVVGEPVEQGRGHLGVAEDGGPFAEGQVGGDDH